MAPTWQSIMLGSSISFSFTLAGKFDSFLARNYVLKQFSYNFPGNVVTQPFMTVPALLVDFPNHSSPNYAARTTLLGRQGPYYWAVGNIFFGPINTLGVLGYAYSSYYASHSATTSIDWRVLAIAALMHVVTVLHSALNMQPLNDRLAALDPGAKEAKGAYGTQQAGAEALLRKWGK
jgi:hypothetical protein